MNRTANWQFMGQTWRELTPESLGSYAGKIVEKVEHEIHLSYQKRGTRIRYQNTHGTHFGIFGLPTETENEDDLKRVISIQYALYEESYSSLLTLCESDEIEIVLAAGIGVTLQLEQGVPVWRVGKEKFFLSDYPSPNSVWRELNAPLSAVRPMLEAKSHIGTLTPVLLERMSQVLEDDSSDECYNLESEYDLEPRSRSWSPVSVDLRTLEWNFRVKGANQFFWYFSIKGSMQLACDLYRAIQQEDIDVLLRYVTIEEEPRWSFFSEVYPLVSYPGNQLIVNFTADPKRRGYWLISDNGNEYWGLIEKTVALNQLKHHQDVMCVFQKVDNESKRWPTHITGKEFKLLRREVLTACASVDHEWSIEEHGICATFNGYEITYSVKLDWLVIEGASIGGKKGGAVCEEGYISISGSSYRNSQASDFPMTVQLAMLASDRQVTEELLEYIEQICASRVFVKCDEITTVNMNLNRSWHYIPEKRYSVSLAKGGRGNFNAKDLQTAKQISAYWAGLPVDEHRRFGNFGVSQYETYEGERGEHSLKWVTGQKPDEIWRLLQDRFGLSTRDGCLARLRKQFGTHWCSRRISNWSAQHASEVTKILGLAMPANDQASDNAPESL